MRLTTKLTRRKTEDKAGTTSQSEVGVMGCWRQTRCDNKCGSGRRFDSSELGFSFLVFMCIDFVVLVRGSLD